MLGLGERESEVIRVMRDLLDVGCRLLTLGQYLQPSREHHPVVRYLHPDEFEDYKALGERMGFMEVASGPFVRSSFRAAQMYRNALGLQKGKSPEAENEYRLEPTTTLPK
jgi:lipoic acid synthetase